MFARPKPEQYLLPTERRVLRTRQHWAKLVPHMVFTIVVVFVLVWLSWLIPVGGVVAVAAHTVLWYAQIGVLARMALRIADWWDDILMVTDERILNVRGLFASRMRDTPISKITERDIQHTIIGNLLGYGTITITAAGHKALQNLTYVPEPLTVFEAIAKLTSKGGLPSPAEGPEVSGSPPSIEQRSAAWPVVEGDGE